MKTRSAWLHIAGWVVLSTTVYAAQIDYTYDAAGRLLRTDYGGGTRVEYTYDVNGNLLVRSSSSGGQYLLIYRAADGGGILGAATQVVAHGASGAAVTAVTNRYFRFVEWSDGKAGAARTDTNVAANATYVAHFSAILAAQGTPHWWLAAHGYTNHFDAAEMSDTDGDTFTAKHEYMADTNPTNPASFFRVLNIHYGPPVVVHFEPASTGRVYTFQFTDDLSSGIWSHVPGSIPRLGAGGPDALIDTNQPPHRTIYRIGVEVP